MTTHLQRIVVVGTSGSGKTTFAAELARILDLTHFDLDHLHFGPNWTPRPEDEFHRLLTEAAAGDRWVTTGNYSHVRDLLWPRATTIIWLNYNFATVFSRVFRRTVRRIVTQELACNGNRESIRLSFFSRDSILLWTMTTFRRNQARYMQLRSDKTYPHLEWIEFRRPREAAEFLDSMKSSCSTSNRCA